MDEYVDCNEFLEVIEIDLDTDDDVQEIIVSNGNAEDVTKTDEIDESVEKAPEKKKGKKVGRKRARNSEGDPSTWKKNLIKSLRQAGKEYVSASGKVVPGKTFSVRICEGCPFKCHTKFEESELREMFEHFYSIDLHGKRQLLAPLIEDTDVKRVRTSSPISRRTITHRYYLLRKPRERVKVCRNFFCHVFQISDKFIQTVVNKRNKFCIVEPDRRGKHQPGNRKTDEVRAMIRHHINAFPRVASHYCSAGVQREYLPQELSVSRMYKMYSQYCRENGLEPQKYSLYYQIFKSDFNLAFCAPEEDKCDTCFKLVNDSAVYPRNECRKMYAIESTNVAELDSGDVIRHHISKFPTLASKTHLPHDLSPDIMYELYCSYCHENNVEPQPFSVYYELFLETNLSFHAPRPEKCGVCSKFESGAMESEYERHVHRESEAKSRKKTYKERARAGEIHYFVFEMQPVKYCPHVADSTVFYRRRLAMYNCTVCNVATGDSFMYAWSEDVAKHGANEVASCLFLHLTKFADGRPVYLLSDSQGGLTCNVNMSLMFAYAVHTLDIPEISHTYSEPGHPNSECIAVQNAVDRTAAGIHIYDPSGWYAVMRLAPEDTNYNVREMGREDFLNFAQLKNKLTKGRRLDKGFEKLAGTNVVECKYLKENCSLMRYKLDYESSDYEMLPLLQSPASGTDVENVDTFGSVKVPAAYFSAVPLADEKVKDLTFLCMKRIIPTPYHYFYKFALCVDLSQKNDERRNKLDNDIVLGEY